MAENASYPPFFASHRLLYLIANENAVPFYEKLGMKRADDVMQYNHIEWTEFTVT